MTGSVEGIGRTVPTHGASHVLGAVRLASRNRDCIRTRSTPSQSGVRPAHQEIQCKPYHQAKTKNTEPADFQETEVRYRDGEGDAPSPHPKPILQPPEMPGSRINTIGGFMKPKTRGGLPVGR
jgi:hypothetical protein